MVVKLLHYRQNSITSRVLPFETRTILARIKHIKYHVDYQTQTSCKMAGFNGKWRLVEVEKMHELQEAAHAPKEYIERCKLLYSELKTNPQAYVEELHFDQSTNTVQRKLIVKGEVKMDKLFTLGVETKTVTASGREANVKIVLVNENKVTLHEKGEGFEVNSTFDLKGDELQVTSKAGSVVGVMKYKKA